MSQGSTGNTGTNNDDVGRGAILSGVNRAPKNVVLRLVRRGNLPWLLTVVAADNEEKEKHSGNESARNVVIHRSLVLGRKIEETVRTRGWWCKKDGWSLFDQDFVSVLGTAVAAAASWLLLFLFVFSWGFVVVNWRQIGEERETRRERPLLIINTSYS